MKCITAVACLMGICAATGAMDTDDGIRLVANSYVKHNNHLNNATNAFKYAEPMVGMPVHTWEQPYDWEGGKLYERIEIYEQPTNTPVNYQMCLFRGDWTKSANHACFGYHYFEGPGLSVRHGLVANIYNGKVLTQREDAISKVMFVLKDKKGNPIDNRFGFGGKWIGYPDYGLYATMRLRYTSFLVPAGQPFTPPPWWDKPSSWQNKAPALNVQTTALAGGAYSIASNATDPDGSIWRVEFFTGEHTLLGRSEQAPYTITWQPTASTEQEVHVIAYDNEGRSVNQTITVSLDGDRDAPSAPVGLIAEVQQ